MIVSPGDAAVTAAPIVEKAAVLQGFVAGTVVTAATDVVGVAGGATYNVAPEELPAPPAPW
jgi:hypothetical protein